MKYTKRNMLCLIAFVMGLALTISGCAENHYYDTYHHHSREWYEHHHEPPPPGVNFNVELHN